MRKKILWGYFIIIFFTFIIPVVFTTFGVIAQKNIKTEENKVEIEENNQNIISVFSEQTGKITNENMEEYLVGVVAAEMPALYETEALKAQAVAARSYIISKIGKENENHPDALVCDNPAHCKAYLSLNDAKKKWGDRWESDFYKKIKTAVDETKGECLTYDDKIVQAFFFALSNGKTESSEDVWGSSLPYLKSTDSPLDSCSSDFKSVKEISLKEFNDSLKVFSKDYKPSGNINVGNVLLTDGGRVKEININNTLFKGTDIRNIFSLNSADFNIKQNGDKIIFNVCGKGHGVGMSQFGANELAKKGYTYKDILKHYYKDVEIKSKWD